MINIANLYFGYTKRLLFNNLNLKILKSGIYGILGKNGAGKTTLLKIISGQIFPDRGACRVFNKDSCKRLPETLSKMFFLPENFYLPGLKPETFKKIYSPFYPDFDSKLFYRYLDRYEIEPEKPLSAMSYGQKKKFLLSFGIATNSEILILDEPTNGLDIPSKAIFRSTTTDLKDQNRTVIISTHQVRDVEEIIDPIIIIDNGNIILNEEIKSIKNSLSFQYAEIPPHESNILYSEKIGDKYKFVSVKAKDSDSDTEKIDIELLFTAAINNPEIIKKIFLTDNKEV